MGWCLYQPDIEGQSQNNFGSAGIDSAHRLECLDWLGTWVRFCEAGLAYSVSASAGMAFFLLISSSWYWHCSHPPHAKQSTRAALFTFWPSSKRAKNSATVSSFWRLQHIPLLEAHVTWRVGSNLATSAAATLLGCAVLSRVICFTRSSKIYTKS